MREQGKKIDGSGLKIIYSDHLQVDPLSDHDTNLNRLDALINSMSQYECDEDSLNFMLSSCVTDLIKVKLLYLAWI